MKRLIVIWIVCSSLSLGSFGMLMFADRRLDVPVPYSLAFALAALVTIAPAVFALFEWVRGRRPIVVHVTPVVEPAPAATAARPARVARRRRPRGVEGVVLLDCSARGVRAA
jgi:hypothetical protein